MNSKGLTLPELLIALSIACTSMLLATSAGTYAIASWQLRDTAFDLYTAFHFARQRAVTSRRPVVIRNIANSWSKGWTVFVDADSNTLPGTNEPKLLIESPHNNLNIKSNFGNYVRYLPNGESRYANGAFMAGTFLICSTTQNTLKGRKLVLQRGGRVRGTTTNTCTSP